MTWREFMKPNSPLPPFTDVAAWGVCAAINFVCWPVLLWWAFSRYRTYFREVK